jgi:hypothetical protein
MYRPSLQSVRDRIEDAMLNRGGDTVRAGGLRHRYLTRLLAEIDQELCHQAEAIGEFV